MWSKKWYLKRNISCDAHLLNELLETDVPWDDAIVVSAGKLSELWDSPSELRSSLCERRLEMTVLRPALLPVKTAQFTQFFPSGMTSHSKIALFNWKCIPRFAHESTWESTGQIPPTLLLLSSQTEEFRNCWYVQLPDLVYKIMNAGQKTHQGYYQFLPPPTQKSSNIIFKSTITKKILFLKINGGLCAKMRFLYLVREWGRT